MLSKQITSGLDCGKGTWNRLLEQFSSVQYIFGSSLWLKTDLLNIVLLSFGWHLFSASPPRHCKPSHSLFLWLWLAKYFTYRGAHAVFTLLCLAYTNQHTGLQVHPGWLLKLEVRFNCSGVNEGQSYLKTTDELPGLGQIFTSTREQLTLCLPPFLSPSLLDS